MPSRDRRLNPDLERALPADSTQTRDYRIVREVWEVLFGSGEWRPVTVRAAWKDRRERLVIMLEWSIAGESWRGAYLWAAGKVRDA